MNPLLELLDHGQSYWLDNLTRGMIASGALQRRVEEEGLRGVTSNPAIFHKAITGGEEYDDDIRRLAREGLAAPEIYERLVVADIQAACDVLRPVHESSRGVDGYVSLEVSPYLAHDAERTLEEARRLFRAVDRPNVFIKIPGTPAGVWAIEEALWEGIHINVTLLFSIEAYEAVAEAHLRALERRLEAGRSLDGVASVASFFLSRIDVLADRLLGHRIRPGHADPGHGPEALLGRVAVANAKVAYRGFLERLRSDRWRRLEAEGARPQRMLWASTSTKDPLYDDVRYVEPLIGPHTVNTLPDGTITAFADHGRVATTVEEDLEEAEAVLAGLDVVGLELDRVTDELLDEGVEKFIRPYDRLMAALAERRARHLGGALLPARVEAGPLQAAWTDGLASLDGRQFGRRLAARDASLWTSSPAVAEAVSERLGWLDAPAAFRARTEELAAFAREAVEEGLEDVVLLGMGGSSLAAEVAARVFGPAESRPRLTVLDSTDPAAVRAVERAVDPAGTLFLVASKSGTTTETWSLYRRFLELAEETLGEAAADRFVAVTDPGSPLEEEAEARCFRRTFLNPPDVGGRYSALTWFGLVPMALCGLDVDRLLERAEHMAGACDAQVPAGRNPGLRLGALLGLAARHGRDKVTLVLSDRLAPFGAWVEQLLAESTGKEGRGLVPVVGEPRAADEPGEGEAPYGADRIFVGLRLEGEAEASTDGFLEARAAEGHPTAGWVLEGPEDLGAEFLRWEVATATAGAVLGVNPFDEPDVRAAKRNTRELLDAWAEGEGPREPEPAAEDDALAVHVAGEAAGPAWTSPEDALAALLETVQPGGYVALLAFLAPAPERDARLASLRRVLGRRLGVATTAGYGPRYLHSTGQLHKGGREGGVFLVLTADPAEELPIPGEAHGFGTLLRAQALGDVRALAERGRRVARVHLKGDAEAGLERLERALAPAGTAAPTVGAP